MSCNSTILSVIVIFTFWELIGNFYVFFTQIT